MSEGYCNCYLKVNWKKQCTDQDCIERFKWDRLGDFDKVYEEQSRQIKLIATLKSTTVILPR